MKLMPPYSSGQIPSTTDADLFWMLDTLSRCQRIGRKNLAATLELGEGSLRRPLEMLRKSGLVEIYQTGIVISDEGRKLLKKIPIVPVEMDVPGSVIGEYRQAIIVKNAGPKITNGQIQRDAGIRMGSEGCTTLVYRNGRLMVPPDWDLDSRDTMTALEIRKVREFEAEDAAIIGCGDSKRVARNAAVTAALELI